MHQTPRQPPRPASPAASPSKAPARTNTPIEGRPRTMSGAADRTSTIPPGSSEDRTQDAGPSKESMKKLDQIVQNCFMKAGTLVLQNRLRLTPVTLQTGEKRMSRWFQTDTDDFEEFRDEFRIYKQCSGFDNRPPPLFIEIYLDTSRLKNGQSLVIVDEDNKRHDVAEAMNSWDSAGSNSGRQDKHTNTRIVLERWRAELKGSTSGVAGDFGPLLATIYKKAIVLFRSIFTTVGVFPASKLFRGAKIKGSHPALQLRARVSTNETLSSGFDALRSPLTERPSGDITTDYMFGSLELPVGRFYVSVSYRNNCTFQVAETESLLSSRISLAISDDLFKPSLPRRGVSRRDYSTEVGSLPSHRHTLDATDNQQRYGSLSTFHGEGPLGTSPISALRSIKAPGSDTTSPPDSRPASVEVPAHSLPIRPSITGSTASARRPSVSFQPFKHGSLSGSPVPRLHDHDTSSSPHSLGRGTPTGNALTQPRNRSSLTAGMPASLRGGPPPASETPPVAGSPRPSAAGRFSSSFSHRRNRASYGGASRAGDDDQISSGKQSASSSLAQPGSGLLNEVGGGGSSGSFQTDDDNIQEFLKMIDSKKTLQSFEPSKKGETSTKRTNAQLSRFHLMRESNNALTESLNSSVQLQRSSSSSSRQLANVPGMSASSSPGKPLSPHTPHTPAVPSRLSEGFSADHGVSTHGQNEGAGLVPRIPASVPSTIEETRGAIDIPLSPRAYPHVRRCSSVAQQNRALVDEEEAEAHRSTSLGAVDGEAPSISALLSQQTAANDGAAESPMLEPPTDLATAESSDMLPRGSSSVERESRPPAGLFAGLSSSPQRGRFSFGTGRGHITPQSGNSSLTGPSNRYGRGYARGGASGMGALGSHTDETEEEPLLFDMSELGQNMNRRSLEEARGGASLGSNERGGYESSRGRRW
ncbi:autophagy-related protein 13-domain-containing protein [Apiospora arundinis]|uniref:Autophagy-related protein 13 n=1 Tax=Apiospora arundinis TaxID=335852 RepID=A0ABR2I098_9PEZI